MQVAWTVGIVCDRLSYLMHSIIFVWLLLVLFPSNFINCVFFYIQSYYFYYHFSVCFAVSKSSYRTIDLPVCLCVLLYVQCWRISAYTHLVQFGCLQPRERKECNKGATASSLKHNCARARTHTHTQDRCRFVNRF